MTSPGFQRARSPEQQDQRREQILAAARDLLADHGPEEVSLRELSRVVGLAKSNVLRYFPTREAVFLAVLAGDLDAWLDQLATAMPRLDARHRPATRHRRIAATIAETVADHPRLCDLLAAAQSVLERNIPPSTAREFKSVVADHLDRLAALVEDAGVEPPASAEFARYVWVLVAGAWPMAHPTPVVAAVLDEPRFASLRVEFVPDLARVLTVLLDGLSTLPGSRADVGTGERR